MTARILIAAHSGHRGGAEYCLDTTLARLDRSRFDARVLFAWDGPLADSARDMGYAVEVWPLAWWMGYEPSLWHLRNATAGSVLRVARLVRRLKKDKIDLVYTNTAVIYEAALAARLARVPHVWHVHEVLTPAHTRPRMFPLKRMVRWIGRWSERVVFESDAARAVVRGAIAEEKTRTVHNSVRFAVAEESAEGKIVGWDKRSAGPPPSPATPVPRPLRGARGEGTNVGGPALRLSHPTVVERDAGRERLGLADDHCAVVWIGRFSERKNPQLLLKAIPKMQHAQACRFLFMGEGPLDGDIRQMIDAMGLGGQCRMLPFLDDVRPVLAAADVLALTSREESFGLVLVEAAACGVPAVATRTQGPAEIVVDGQTGLLVAPDDALALAAAIDRLAADPVLRQAMGGAAARRAAAVFSPEKNTRKLEHVFDEAISAGALARRQN